MPWVYMLECADGSYYVGSTRDLERRFLQHASGEGAAYTRRRRPVVLVFAEAFARIDDAYFREKQVQGWSRKKRQALIAQNYEALPDLSGSLYKRRGDD
jgi:putative endonuclease